MIELALLLEIECSAPAPATVMGRPFAVASPEIVPTHDGFLVFVGDSVCVCSW